MATSGKQRRGTDLPGKGPAAHDQQQEQLPDFEQVIEGGELSAEVAGQLQPQMGNEAIMALLAKAGASEQATLAGAEQEEEELLEVDEELADMEVEVKAIGGGGSGAPSTPADADPWDVGLLFGGQDDPDTPTDVTTSKQDGPGARAATTVSTDRWAEEDDRLPLDAFDRVDGALGTTPPMGETQRMGDGQLRAVEAALMDPRTIGRRGLEPESLVDRTDHLDPVGRPAAIGRFMVRSAARSPARVLARVLSGPASALVPAASGHAGAVARMASLAVCVEALEGQGQKTDRAVALALCRDAWPDAVISARYVAKTGRLVAPDILAKARRDPPAEVQPAAHSAARTHSRELASTRLGNAALAHIVPDGFIPNIPNLVERAPPPSPLMDPNVAAADAALERFISGTEPADLPAEPVLQEQQVQPMLNAASALINAMGRAQVEFAAAALAISRVRPSLELQQTLHYADKALRKLARAVVSDGDRLHKAIGTPLMMLGGLPEQVHSNIHQSATALKGLRTWAFSALVQEMNQ